jgi:cyanate lyase
MAAAYTPSAGTQAVTTEIVEAMSARDVTVDELAVLTGLGPIALANRLDGRRTWNLDELYAVGQALQVSVWALLVPDLDENA